MKLIIEQYPDGDLYVYRETEAKFKRNQPSRINIRNIRTLESLDHECFFEPGDCIAVTLSQKQT